MKITEALNQARDAITVERVYAEPYEKNGLTVIPAALVRGGAGGGTGHDDKGQEGEGGGFGVQGRPTGAYVIQEGKVSWLPAVDVNRIVTMVGLAVVAYLLSRSRVTRARGKASRGKSDS